MHPDAPPPLDLLQEGAAGLHLELAPATLEQFRTYLRELQRWNARINLTGLKTHRDIVVKHFLDSLAVAPFIGEASSQADLGSGAGFPGLVLKLVRPAITLTLVEARSKKAAFLEFLVAALGLTGVEVRQAHLTPALARKWGPRFQAVVTRATFPLDRLLELAAPLLKPGGLALALKGPHLAEPELNEARRRAEILGLSSLEVREYQVPLGGGARLAVLARRGA